MNKMSVLKDKVEVAVEEAMDDLEDMLNERLSVIVRDVVSSGVTAEDMRELLVHARKVFFRTI